MNCFIGLPSGLELNDPSKVIPSQSPTISGDLITAIGMGAEVGPCTTRLRAEPSKLKVNAVPGATVAELSRTISNLVGFFITSGHQQRALVPNRETALVPNRMEHVIGLIDPG